ncbi:hypothetical protein MKW92_027717 [Papaver armeniacum]|nr:hypothetical protein MKW92_027717 [Papaver armeniacum]
MDSTEASSGMDSTTTPKISTLNVNPNNGSYISKLMNGNVVPSSWFEIRLFYVRISPCLIDKVPEYLKICHLRREIGVSLEINGSRIPSSDTVSLKLRRDRMDKETSEVTYVSTDSVRVMGSIEFEVYENENVVILCGSLERMESPWGNGNNHQGLENDSKTGWSMDCCTTAAAVNSTGSSAFYQPKLGISSPSIEVYVAGCCSGTPLILTKTINLSPRRKPPRHGALDAIPEDEETERVLHNSNGVVRHRKVQVSDSEADEYDSEGKIIPHDYYPQDAYYDEDGQLSWFNAGVRVGVGIGLGMCLGIGIGVGLLMRSYQATTRNFRRRFI